MRTSKKQRELLEYIDDFIREHGYGPSYREIMRGLGYKSVSTVAVHIDGLITGGYIRKRDHSARSIEIITTGPVAPPTETPLVALLEAEIDARRRRDQIDDIETLIAAARLLGSDIDET